MATLIQDSEVSATFYAVKSSIFALLKKGF
jgi:hypothetical protein